MVSGGGIARKLTKAVPSALAQPKPLRLCYFARVASSPITWDNVILYGEYVLDRDLIRL